MYPRLFLLGGLWACPALAFSQALHEGDIVPDFTLSQVVNRSTGSFTSTEAKGKVLVVEFWGTWCGPCIPPLLHLDSLQRAFPQELQVVGVADDSEQRVRTFLARRPVQLPLAAAPTHTEAIYRYFPHNTVPHTVVIGKDQRVLAITRPEQLTATALRDILAGKPAALQTKHDVVVKDPLVFFPADTATQFAVSVRPYLQGQGSQLRRDQTPGLRGRRLTAINMPIETLFRQAYGVSHLRLKNELPALQTSREPANLVCFDLVVPPPEAPRLLQHLRDELPRHFPVQARLVPETKPVYVLRQSKSRKPWPGSKKPENGMWSGKGVDLEGSRIEMLREFLENMSSKPVVDETGLTGRYDIKLELQPEASRADVLASLQQLGLELQETTRKIDVLHLSPAASTARR
ncbi:TIGR03435 family protein [Hymenobacter sp. HSC-4F20]|uniref:TIGR03435 family protein n=1 Tax=Hymenobacter sp. HSC-4F20 TaxID=2864135 RepID=UPI001C72B919|nr:TIGR03435 family protein [Hymenobacter sp. HSC-4F20]MBX0292919.1 TIGR03435 family protein [Hymenobacter sp. HSC-4F20]